MKISKEIIKKFGGQSSLAKLLNKGQPTIQYWAANGIPSKWYQRLINLAKEKRISLNPDDFFEKSTKSKIVNHFPRATHWGDLPIGDTSLPCYILSTGERVFSLKGAVVGLIKTEGGQLAEYIKVKNIKPYLSSDLTPAENDNIPALIKFDTGVKGIAKYAWGLPVEKFMDLCVAYSKAADNEKLTDRQKEIAINANRFLRSCAKVGIIALVDEVTGFQYERAKDSLQLKLKVFLAEEMREWEKTFPDQLWVEFARLTKWQGGIHRRPKYWGKLVMELVYGYLDKDVADWLRKNAPKPNNGQNYHQWLSAQYGLKKLIEHLWMLIGMASACETIQQLKENMAVKFGRMPIQLTLYLPPQKQK